MSPTEQQRADDARSGRLSPTEQQRVGRRRAGIRLDRAGWRVVGAVLGHEDFLVGQSPRNQADEALVLVPPGVKVPAPAGCHPRVSSEGWRVALWSADSSGVPHVDVGEPTYVSPVPLAFVIGLVEAECPEHLSWVADRLALPIMNACAVQHPDRGGKRFAFADKWTRRAEASLDELDVALTSLPDDQGPDGTGELDADLFLDPQLAGARAWPQHPGEHDERLCEGRLREMYNKQRNARVAYKR